MKMTKGPEDIAADICTVLGLYRPDDHTVVAGLLESWSEALLSERETLAREKAELVEKVRVLSEALKFYADRSNWQPVKQRPDDDFVGTVEVGFGLADYRAPHGYWLAPALDDHGKIAARALSPEPIGASNG